MRVSFRLLLPPLVCALAAFGQDSGALPRDPALRAAMEAARKSEPQTLELQARLCGIPAPPFHEEERGRELKRLFEQAGLRDVRVDSAGNVIGVRPGRSPRPNVVLAAHLDTVFPPETALEVVRKGGALACPGIGDDARGLAAMLAVARALNQARVETRGTITFVADTGEEGLGDLRGMKALFNETFKGQIDSFVSIDGAGYGITNVGVGSLRYRVTFKGPGGHSYGAFGMANPTHALGRAIAKIDAFKVPAQPKTTFNVGRVGGGTSVNSIAGEAWMEVDLRSAGQAALESLNRKFHAALQAAVAEENRRWNNRSPVSASAELVGKRPAGRTPSDSGIVRTAIALSLALKVEAALGDGSTDANLPMSLGIPAITIGGGGSGSGVHSAQETFDAAQSWLGVQRALLLVAALAN